MSNAETAALAAGPLLPSAAAGLPLVNIAATALRSAPPAEGEEPAKREPVYYTRRLVLIGDGQRQPLNSVTTEVHLRTGIHAAAL